MLLDTREPDLLYIPGANNTPVIAGSAFYPTNNGSRLANSNVLTALQGSKYGALYQR
jgi:hypothetical protein